MVGGHGGGIRIETSAHFCNSLPAKCLSNLLIRCALDRTSETSVEQRLATSSWWCSPRFSIKRWAEMTRQIFRGIRPSGLPQSFGIHFWSRPWGVTRLLGLHEITPRPHLSEGVG